MIQVAIDAGAAFLPASALLVALWQRLGVSPQESRGAFNADPLSVLARDGKLPLTAATSLNMMADLAKWTAEHYPGVTAVGVNTSPYHDAGASAAHDIAFGAATGVEYLRSMADAGMDVETAAGQILFRMNLGTNHFLAIAKLRAARWVWSRVLEASGVSRNSCVMRIHARTGNRALTKHDPYVNLLRNSVGVFAAGLGGADTITSVPFDALTGLPDAFSRRVARNTALVLQEESHLNRVIDPAGGSWFLDDLTKELASKAWEIFQETDRRGGMLSALTSGWVSAQIDAAYLPRAKDIASRKQGITGISEFPNVDESRIQQSPPDFDALRLAAATRIANDRQSDSDLSGLASAKGLAAAAIDEAAKGATIGQIAGALGFGNESCESLAAIAPRNLAGPFEQLRDACDVWQETHGQRPKVFLANLGPLSHHGGRATWSKNFFEAGGFEVIGNNGFDNADDAAATFGSSGARIAVICSSDKLYPDFVPSAAAKLKEAGASSIVLAGHPGENEQAWAAAGVDRFIFMKCNVLETLRELLRDQGVIERNNQSNE
jgi:methylmalonyl-CoA mutase